MRHFPLWFVLVALSCAACSGSTDGSGSAGGPSTSMSLEEFQAAVAVPLCDRLALCCSGTTFDRSACLSKGYLWETDGLDLDESREFLGQNAAACVKAYESAPMTCEALYEDTGIKKACARSLLSNGTRKPGEACAGGNECVSSEATRGDCVDNVCVSILIVRQAGPACNGEKTLCDMEANLYCDIATKTCKAGQAIGDPCEMTCTGFKMTCDQITKQCISYEKGLGDACDTSGANEHGGCVPGYECKNGKCEVDPMLCSVLGN